MKSDDLISVLVIAYNSCDTIIETLNSIASQTYPNIEIVISDDCSADDTVNIAKDWLSYYKGRSVLITSEINTGTAGNLNRAIRGSAGKYVKLIAADDMLYPEAIEKFYLATLSASEKTIWQSKVEVFGSDSITKSETIMHANDCYNMLSDPNKDFYIEMLKNFSLMPMAIGLMPISVFTEVGFFDETYPLVEDYPFFLKLMEYGYNYKLLDKTLVKYRVSSNSVCHKKNKVYRKTVASFFFKNRFRKLIKNKMYYLAFKKSIRFSLFRLGFF